MERWLRLSIEVLAIIGAMSLVIQRTGEVLIISFILVFFLLILGVIRMFRLPPIKIWEAWEEGENYGRADFEDDLNIDVGVGNSMGHGLASGVPECAYGNSC